VILIQFLPPVSTLLNELTYALLYNHCELYQISFARTALGRLGLSREELDNRCKPSGLYERSVLDGWIVKSLFKYSII
jgi:hypothetical protein